MKRSVEFFENQFRRQVAARDLALNPFESRVLPHVRGTVLDFGCGTGNLSLAAARQGCPVLALDAAPTAIRHLAAVAAREGLALQAVLADLEDHAPEGEFDTVVSIGLLMFLPCAAARRQLARLRECVRPGGVAAINILVQGTTYLEMFDPAAYCLFPRDELRARFDGWDILAETTDDFPAPGDTRKSFVTLVARKPCA